MGRQKRKKHAETLTIFFGGPTGPIHPVWAVAAIRLWRGCMFLRSDGKVMGAGDNCYDQSDMQSVHCLDKGYFAVISCSMYDIM